MAHKSCQFTANSLIFTFLHTTHHFELWEEVESFIGTCCARVLSVTYDVASGFFPAKWQIYQADRDHELILSLWRGSVQRRTVSPPPHLCPGNLPKFFAILANYFCQLYRMYLCWNLAIQIHFFKYCGAEVARSRIILGGRRWFRNATYSSGSDGSFNVVSLEPHQKLTEKLAPKIEKMSF
jgi:hypothetical protein